MSATRFGFIDYLVNAFLIYSRWLRLLFGREYSLPDLLVLWDALFADATDGVFGLTSYVVVAMLVQIRQKCEWNLSAFMDQTAIEYTDSLQCSTATTPPVSPI